MGGKKYLSHYEFSSVLGMLHHAARDQESDQRVAGNGEKMGETDELKPAAERFVFI